MKESEMPVLSGMGWRYQSHNALSDLYSCEADFMAPEVWYYEPQSVKSDAWALGV
jgi:serine/threonine protein kinase